VNFLAILSLLNFGSAYAVALEEQRKVDTDSDEEEDGPNKAGIFMTIVQGAISLHLAGSKLNADSMVDIVDKDIEKHFSVPIRQVKAVEGTPITMEVEDAGGPFVRYVAAIRFALNDTGRVLRERGVDSLGAFVMQALLQHGPSAAGLVQELTKAFDAFCDEATLGDNTVTFHRKAQLLAGELYRRFASEDPRFAFQDLSQLTAHADDVLPAVLRHLGCITLAPELCTRIEGGHSILHGSEMEVALRAKSITVVEEIATQAGEGVAAVLISYYLIRVVGEREELRRFPRHRCQDTLAY